MPVVGHEEDDSPTDESYLSEEEEEAEHARQVSSWKDLPWWKRPSPYWLICGSPFGSIGFAALLAPKVALYTTLACRVHRPEYILNDVAFSFLPTSNFVVTTASVAHLPFPHVSDDTFEPAYVHLSYPANTASLDYTQDSDSEQRCASDPVVQATAARLSAVFATSLGIFACLTTGWWSTLSDRYGRRVVLFASVFGLFVTDATHVLTAWFVDVLPGGYWFPLVGSFVEGLCGGMPTGVAMFHTYLADTTDPSTRSRYFALALGVMYAGAAVGPILGGLLLRWTGNLLSVFYFSTILHGIYSVLILFVLPESLTPARARGAHLRRSQEKANRAPPSNRAFGILKSSARFFGPLLVLLPARLSDAKTLKQRRDWSLFLVAIAYALVTNIESVAPYKLQYAAAQFRWAPEITSYYVSSVSVSRALFLAVILPLIIKHFKPAPIQLPSTTDEPLRGHSSLSFANSPQDDRSGRRVPTSRSAVFDLILARVSAVLQATSYLGLAIAHTGTLFTLASVVSSFAAGFSPAAQSLALDIYASRCSKNRGEVGKLYGALSILQVLAAQIVTPALYGFVYAKTVSVFPQAIMVVSVCMASLALVLLSFVRIRSSSAIFEDGNREHGRTVACETVGAGENGVAGER